MSGATDGSSSLASFQNPMGVAVSCVGMIYVADTFNSKIRMVTTSGLKQLLSVCCAEENGVVLYERIFYLISFNHWFIFLLCHGR